MTEPRQSSLIRRCWILLPALALYFLDISLTLIGQPAEYWAGDRNMASEFNPVAHPLLAAGATWFAIAAVLWAAVFATFILVARPSIARVAAYLITFGHSIGALTWLVRHGSVGWVAAGALLFGAAWFAGHCWKQSVSNVDCPKSNSD